MEKVIYIKQATKQGYIACKNGGVFDCSYPTSKLRRGRVQGGGEISPTLTCESGGIVRIEVMENGFFQQALETAERENAKPGDIVDAFNGRVHKDGISPTITTRPEGKKTAVLPVVEDKRNMEEEKTMEGGKYEKTISFEVLCILRKTIGEKEFSEWAERGICYFLQKEVLQHKLYAERIFEDWEKQSDMGEFSLFCKENKSALITEDKLRDLWKEWEIGCSPYRSRLSEQQFGELTSFMQKLSYEDTSAETLLQNMWDACEGIGILQQALHSIQEIWESVEKKRQKYAIRKLTPLETWRLMNFSDDDFYKAQAVNSNSQLYKQSGNSIVKAVLIAIFSQLGIQGHKKWNEMTVEERRALVYKGTILEK